MALLAAPRPGAAGRQGNTVGAYLCADLACSLSVCVGGGGGKKQVGGVRRGGETLTPEQKIDRLRGNLREFLVKIGVDDMDR
ncbi:FBP domain-containing protein [Streptomyces albus subsp. chlorinus]|uniref:FBP domain-containing protein n=1 Tax=Streptomyces albus TaxID=1888 RepID=UPI003D12C82B